MEAIKRRPFHRVAEVLIAIICCIICVKFIGIIRVRFVVISTHQNNHHDRYGNTAIVNVTSTTDGDQNSDIYMTIQTILRRSLFLNHDDRIVGGVPVEDGEFPFFVHPVGMLLCGTTLIHPEYVYENSCH